MTAAEETARVLERTLRPSRATGVRADAVLTAALLSELLAPGLELWLVSAWISDVPVLDNTRGEYDSLLEDPSARAYTLAEILGILTDRGIMLTVVTRGVPENQPFLDRLTRGAAERQLRLEFSPEVHEKTLCGSDWLLSGSMNFTFSGTRVNDEAVTYKVDAKAAAEARIDYTRRWPTLMIQSPNGSNPSGDGDRDRAEAL